MADLPEFPGDALPKWVAEKVAAVADETPAPMDLGGDLAGIRDWAGKAVGAAMRIAGLPHLAEHLRDGYDRPISGVTAANAIRIIDYYTLHALAAFDAMSTDETIVRAHAVLD